MAALEHHHGGAIDIPATGPGRELGQKRKPQLRLALGYRDEERRGAPVKTDHFIPRGNDVVVAKFQRVYGDKPRVVDIRLPGTLGGFLDIRHVAFVGGQNEGGGSIKAIGATNFALEGTLGGPDRLTVFDIVESDETDRNGNKIPRLEARELYIDDVNDPEAQALGVYLQATVTFGIPDVLGFGGICEIRSRGKETIDTLWSHAVDIYGSLGARASLLLRPKIVLKESTMLTPRGGKAQLWVVDLHVPESIDEILARARELGQLMPQGAAAALYGPRGQLHAGSPATEPPPADGTDQGPSGREAGAGPQGAADDEDAGAAAGESAAPPHPPAPEDESLRALADAAGSVVPPSGKYSEKGTSSEKLGPKTLAEILEVDPQYLAWAARSIKTPQEYVASVLAFVRVYLPDAYDAAVAARAEARS